MRKSPALFSTRLGRRRIVVVIACLCFVVIAVLLFRDRAEKEKWQSLSAEFVEQVNSLGATLEPGGVGTISVSASDADELVVLPRYCHGDTLIRHFPDQPPAFIDELLQLSDSRQRSPALIWLRGGKIISINPAKIMVGMNMRLQSWKLNGVREIKVVKESQSTNSFLSLNLLEDDPKR